MIGKKLYEGDVMRPAKITFSEMEYFEKLYTLKALYAKVKEILDFVCGKKDEDFNARLNRSYITFVQKTQDILEERRFKKFIKEKPVLFESLLEDAEEISENWKKYRPGFCSFLGKIEKARILEGPEVTGLSEELQDMFEYVDDMIGNIQNPVFIKRAQPGKKGDGYENPIFSLPKDKTFKDVKITFLGDSKVRIEVGDKSQMHYLSEFGLMKTSNGGKQKNKKCLDFLIILSATDGILELKNLSYAERDEVTIRKKELKRALCHIFGTKEDPFYKYDDKKDTHRLKIKIIPLKELIAEKYPDRNIYDRGTKKVDPYADLGDYQRDNCPFR